jgi:hypothetical protein
VIGCGSFVAALSKMNLGDIDMAVIDLDRIFVSVTDHPTCNMNGGQRGTT